MLSGHAIYISYHIKQNNFKHMKTLNYFLSLLIVFCISIVSFAQENIDLLILNKKYEQAILEIDNRLKVSPSIDLYFKKGIVCSNLQKYQEALNAYSEALLLDPNNVEIIIEIAENLSTIGNHKDAEEFFVKAIQLNPDNLTLKAKLGRVYINEQDYRKANDLFAEIYAIDSTNVFWNKQYAYCCFKTSNRLKAVDLYEKVLKANPRDHGTYINLVHTYSRDKERDSILTLINRGLEQFPGNDELYFERANFYFRIKDYENAKHDFKAYFAAKGDSIYDIYLNYAISTYFSSDANEALNVFSNLFRQNPNDPFVLFYMGLCNKKLENYEEAAKYMQWAIDGLYPEYLPEFYHHLGQIYGLDHKYKESLEALKKVNELDPRELEVLFEIAQTYEEYNNNKTLALNYYRLYLTEVGESGKNIDYALTRISKIKEDMFFDE